MDSEKWMLMKIRPIGDTVGNVQALDEYLTKHVPAAITQHLERGEYFYKPEEDGCYELRLFQPQFVGMVRGFVDHFGFEVVS